MTETTIKPTTRPMVRVEMTSHLYRFFPGLKGREIIVPGQSVAEVLAAVNELAPGFTDYVLDERGAVRRHVLISVNDTMLVDRKTLSDRVPEGGTVYVFQALTGG
ncbi:MAG: MoaD/ThiS family protein [Pseudomonadota bacterium]|nr:MoaD/ThiS family protein [Pseudomonadota bacterium]